MIASRGEGLGAYKVWAVLRPMHQFYCSAKEAIGSLLKYFPWWREWCVCVCVCVALTKSSGYSAFGWNFRAIPKMNSNLSTWPSLTLWMHAANFSILQYFGYYLLFSNEVLNGKFILSTNWPIYSIDFWVSPLHHAVPGFDVKRLLWEIMTRSSRDYPETVLEDKVTCTVACLCVEVRQERGTGFQTDF